MISVKYTRLRRWHIQLNVFVNTPRDDQTVTLQSRRWFTITCPIGGHEGAHERNKPCRKWQASSCYFWAVESVNGYRQSCHCWGIFPRSWEFGNQLGIYGIFQAILEILIQEILWNTCNSKLTTTNIGCVHSLSDCLSLCNVSANTTFTYLLR